MLQRTRCSPLPGKGLSAWACGGTRKASLPGEGGDGGRGGKGGRCLRPGRHFSAGQDSVIDLGTAGDVGLNSTCACSEKALPEVEVRIRGVGSSFLCWRRQRK